MAEISTFIVKPNGAKLEMGTLPEGMAAEDVLTLAKASAARQGDAEIALGVVDQEKVGEAVGERNIYLKQSAAKTKG